MNVNNLLDFSLDDIRLEASNAICHSSPKNGEPKLLHGNGEPKPLHGTVIKFTKAFSETIVGIIQDSFQNFTRIDLQLKGYKIIESENELNPQIYMFKNPKDSKIQIPVKIISVKNIHKTLIKWMIKDKEGLDFYRIRKEFEYVDFQTWNPLPFLLESPHWDHRFALGLAAKLSLELNHIPAFLFLSELAQSKDEPVDVAQIEIANQTPFKDLLPLDEGLDYVGYEDFIKLIKEKYSADYVEWKAKRLYIHENFEEVINVLGSLGQPLSSEAAILFALSHYDQKHKTQEGIELAIKTLEKVQEKVRDSRWKLLKWKLDSEMHPEWMQLDANKNTQPDQGAEDLFNSLVKFCKEFKSSIIAFIALMLGIILTFIRFKNIFWSILTSRNTHHTNLLTNIKEMQQFVDRIFQPKQYQNPPTITEILPLIEKIAIGSAQLNKDRQSHFLAHQEIAVQQFFHMGFSSPDQKVRQVALTALKNLAKDYRRCGYESEWYKDLLVDISMNIHQNWAGMENRSQLLNAIFLNDKSILKHDKTLVTNAYTDHDWLHAWRYVHEYVMRLIN